MKNSHLFNIGDSRRHLLSTAFLLGLATQTSWSGSIAYDFSQNPANQVLDTTTPKGPLGTTFWNDSNAEGAPASGSESGLVDGTGAATAASITWSSANTWSNGSGTASENARIMVGYLDDGGSGASVTVSNIPYAKYVAYGIVGSDAGTEYTTRDFRINGTKWAFPVFQFQLDNAGSAGNAGDTTANTGTIEPSGALAGSSDPAMAFNNQTASVPYSAALNPAGSFTVDAWIKPADLNAGNRVIVQSMVNGQNPSNADDRSGWAFRQNDNELTFLIGGTGPLGGSVFYTTTATTTTDVLTAGVWQHVAVSYESGTQTVRIYVNGNEVLNVVAAAPLIPNFASPVYLGNRGYGGWGFVGALDEVAIYPGVISQPTLASHYANGINAGRPTPYPTLVQASAPIAYWTGAPFADPNPTAGSMPAFGTWQAGGEQWVRIKPDGSQRGNFWRVGGLTGSTCTIQGLSTGTGRGSLAAIIIEEAITPTQLVNDGIKTYDEVALGSGLTSEFRPGLDSTSVDLANGFSTAATHGITITPPSGLADGTYPLIDYTGTIGGAGFAGLSLTPSVNPRYGMTLVNNVAGTSVDLAYTAPAPIVWTGGSGAWNTATTPNWKLESTSAPTVFYPYDEVKFDDFASTGSVAISGPVSPNSIEINNETLAYSFTGGSITGSGGLMKLGAAPLSIATSNSFTGPVELFGGTVEISAADNLGAAGNYALDLASTTLHTTQTLTLGRKMGVLDTVSLEVDAGTEVTAPGGFNGSGILTKTGGGSLRFTSYGGGSFDGDIVVEEGTLIMAGGAFNANLGIGSILVATNAVLLQPVGAFHAFGGAFTTSPSLTLEPDATFTVDQENYFDNITMTGAIINGGSEIRSDFAFNATILSSTLLSEWSADINGVNSPVTFNVEDGPLPIDIVMSGVIYNSQPLVKNGDGTLELTGLNSYTGDTTVNGGILAVNGSALPDSGKLVIAGGKVAPTGVEVVKSLFFGAEEKAEGTYGAPGSGAQFTFAEHFSGIDGVISVVPGITYLDWIGTFPGAAGAPGFDQDADFDGIDNGVEHVLGTDPSVSSVGLTQVSGTATSVTFRHTRTNDLALDVTPSYEWSTDLTEWEASGVANTGGTIATIVPTTITDNTAPANDVIEVVATAPGTTKLFVRLVATSP